jgi:hypothetical protein
MFVASILPLIQKGKLSYAAGTSFASPTFAGNIRYYYIILFMYKNNRENKQLLILDRDIHTNSYFAGTSRKTTHRIFEFSSCESEWSQPQTQPPQRYH